jgi:hypothetical protein
MQEGVDSKACCAEHHHDDKNASHYSQFVALRRCDDYGTARLRWTARRRYSRRRVRWVGYPLATGLCVPLQPLQIGSYVGSMLVAVPRQRKWDSLRP